MRQSTIRTLQETTKAILGTHKVRITACTALDLANGKATLIHNGLAYEVVKHLSTWHLNGTYTY